MGELGEPVEGEGVAVGGEEQDPVVGFAGVGVADFVVVAVDPHERPFTDRDQPVLAALALADQQRVAVAVDVEHRQPGKLDPADAGAVEHFEHRPIPHPCRCGQVRHRQHQLGFAGGERGFREAPFDFGELEFGGRVVEQVMVAGGPLEERPHRQQTLRL